MLTNCNVRVFSSGINKGHGYNDEEIQMREEVKNRVLERERSYFNSLSEKEKQYYQAFRLSLVKSIEETWREKNNWWNKVQTMSQDEIEALPNEYMRKFGSFIFRV